RRSQRDRSGSAQSCDPRRRWRLFAIRTRERKGRGVARLGDGAAAHYWHTAGRVVKGLKGRGSGQIRPIVGRGRGYGVWPLHVVIEPLSIPRELRARGEALKPNAHELAKRLLHFAAASERNEGDPVLVPPNLLSEAVLLLLALAGPQPGRPPKVSTLQALRLL